MAHLIEHVELHELCTGKSVEFEIELVNLERKVARTAHARKFGDRCHCYTRPRLRHSSHARECGRSHLKRLCIISETSRKSALRQPVLCEAEASWRSATWKS
eukprot:1329327-Prymnesium_polylepis.2